VSLPLLLLLPPLLRLLLQQLLGCRHRREALQAVLLPVLLPSGCC
jgi:hypothetical protein